MPQPTGRRAELGAFLRARREQIVRADHGLPPAGRGRTVGLRREEVSYLSGVSVTWYTWLEQGRDINPSQQVMDAVARVLRLDDAGRRYALSLAGLPPSSVRDEPLTGELPAHVQHLLDALGDNPAFALTPDWRIAGWNAAYERLYPNVALTPDDDRNLLRLVFTDPAVRALLDDWPETSRRFLGEFRAETAARLADPDVQAFVDRLRADSPEFREGWARHDVQGFTSRERVFHHPDAGLVRYEHHQLRPSDFPAVQIVAYTPVV
jgi:transcriptional regulator with XRE-family HTH domain